MALYFSRIVLPISRVTELKEVFLSFLIFSCFAFDQHPIHQLNEEASREQSRLACSFEKISRATCSVRTSVPQGIKKLLPTEEDGCTREQLRCRQSQSEGASIHTGVCHEEGFP